MIDATLKVDTPFGPVWRRYNHDGYGQRADGTSYKGWGQGRAWPLLTGERGHYELAAGRDPRPFLRAMEGSATGIGLIPEQIWDAADVHERLLRFGGPTGSAIPLLWAHAEYIKLLRSAADGRVFDSLPPVADRYTSARQGSAPLEIWKSNHRVTSISAGTRLRIIADEPFLLHWSSDEWNQVRDTESRPTAMGLEYLDLVTKADDRAPLRFTFYWPKADRWEGRDYVVTIRSH